MGETDSERPAEYVELLIDLGQVIFTTALGALATGYVQRFLKRNKAKGADTPESNGIDNSTTPSPSVRPLMGLTIVNESGGTVIVLNAENRNEAAKMVEQVMDPEWQGRLTF